MRKFLIALPVIALALTGTVAQANPGPSDSPGNSAFGLRTNLRSAYPNIGSNAADRNHVIAVVDAYGYSNAYNDLVAYRRQFFGTSAPINSCTVTSGKFNFSGTAPCFAKVNQSGSTSNLPGTNSGWAQESALDIQMASAMCPVCSILLVEAKTANFSDITAAVNTAGNFAGTVAISNSYGTNAGTDISSSYGYNLPFERATAKNIAVTASTGDNGYGVSFPASVTGVIGAGGTSLYKATSTIWTQSAWSGAGSGCSIYYASTSTIAKNSCGSYHGTGDISAVADHTGVRVNYNGKWYVFGGTSVSAPIIAGWLAVNFDNLSNPSTWVAGKTWTDVTSGSNATSTSSCKVGTNVLCNAVVGWDGPTGLGTPPTK